MDGGGRGYSSSSRSSIRCMAPEKLLPCPQSPLESRVTPTPVCRSRTESVAIPSSPPLRAPDQYQYMHLSELRSGKPLWDVR